MPSVLWCCWLGGAKGIWTVKTECWYTGGCRLTGWSFKRVGVPFFAPPPPPLCLDAPESRIVWHSGAGLTRLSCDAGRWIDIHTRSRDCVCLCAWTWDDNAVVWLRVRQQWNDGTSLREDGSYLVTKQCGFPADHLFKDVFAYVWVNSAEWIV